MSSYHPGMKAVGTQKVENITTGMKIGWSPWRPGDDCGTRRIIPSRLSRRD
jgi:hypothetical protein